MAETRKGKTRLPLVMTDRDHNKPKTIVYGNKRIFENGM